MGLGLRSWTLISHFYLCFLCLFLSVLAHPGLFMQSEWSQIDVSREVASVVLGQDVDCNTEVLNEQPFV